MEIKIIKEQHLKLLNNLDIVFNSNFLKENLSNNIDFQKVIINQISILNSLEENLKTKKTKALTFLSELTNISKQQYKTSDVSLNNKTQIIDDINYLNIYLENIFSKKLDDFKNDEKSESQNKQDKNNEFNNSKTTEEKKDTSSDNNNNFKNNFTNSNFSTKDYKEQFYLNLAYQKLAEDVNKGVFYLYNSKPKIIIFLKKIYFILSFLYGMFCFFPLIIAFILLTKSGLKFDNKDLVFNNSFMIIQFLLYIAFFSLYGINNLFKKTKNDNETFYFNPRNLVIIFILLVFSFSSFLFNINIIQDASIWNSLYAQNIGNHETVDLYKLSLYAQIASFTIFLGFFIYGVVIAFFNPKKDMIRYNEKIKLYVDKFKQEDILK